MRVLSPTPEDAAFSPSAPLPDGPRCPPGEKKTRPVRSRSELARQTSASSSHHAHRKTVPARAKSYRRASSKNGAAGEMEYLAKAGVNRTIASMVKVLLQKLPTSDADVRLALLEWLVARLPQKKLMTEGIVVIPAEKNPEAGQSKQHGARRGSKSEFLLEKLQLKFDEETEIRRTQLDVGMTDEDVGAFREMFLHFDTDRVGGLDMDALLKVIHTCGYTTSTRAINTSFDELLGPPEPPLHPAERNVADAAHEDRRVLSMPHFLRFMKLIDPDRAKSQAKELGFSDAEYTRFHKAFVHVDDENTGLLSEKEVLSAVRACGYTSSAKAVFSTFRALDTDANDAIDFLEFLQLTTRLITDEEQKVLDICEFSTEEFTRYKYAFEKVDRAEKAVLTREEILVLLEDLEISATEKECDIVMSKIDTKKTEEADFIDMMRFIATLRDLKAREEFRREQKERQKYVGWRTEKKFSTTDIFKFQRSFNRYDPLNTNKLRRPEIYMLLKEEMDIDPQSAEEQRRLALLLDSVKENDVTSFEPYFIEFEQFTELLRRAFSMKENEQWISNLELGMSLGFTEDEVYEFREVASLYDADGNHTLELSEIQDLLSSIGRSMPENYVRELFHQFDVDNNGHIEFSEFLHLMKALARKWE